MRARQKQSKKRSLYVINEHFESVFNAAIARQGIIQKHPRPYRFSIRYRLLGSRTLLTPYPNETKID